MRLLAVNHLLDPVSGGGTAERTVRLCRLFAQSGIECAVLTLDIGITPARRAELAGVRIVALPCIARRYFVPRFSWRKLKEEARAADVVLLMGHWTLLNALAFLAARSAGRPHVVCPAGALAIVGRSPLLKRIYNFVIGGRIIRRASGHIAITADEIPYFSAHGVRAEKIAVIPNGAPPAVPRRDCSDFRARHGLARRKFILFLGRLAYVKGPDLLLEAFAGAAQRLPGYLLVYAGPDGGMLLGLQRQAAQLGVEGRVLFLGYVAGVDKDCALQSCELLVIPSRQEAMSIVVLEAGAHGKPVLLTDRCGFNEAEAAGGGRVARATAAALESALVEMISDPGELARMGGRLESHVNSHYTWERAMSGHIALFERALGAG